MASGNINVTTAACFIPEIWSNMVMEAVEFATPVASRVNREYEGEITKGGDTVHVVMQSNYTANTKSAGTDVTFETHTNTASTLLIDKHQYAAAKIEDMAAALVMPGFKERQTKKMGYALARAMDVSLTALFDGFADNGTIGTLGVELTEADYLSAWTKLAEAGAVTEGMVDDDLSIFLSPAAYAAALKVDRLVSKDFRSDGGEGTSKAKLGTIYGGSVFMSNLLESDAAGQHDCAWIHREVLALASRKKAEVHTQYIIEALADAVVVDQIYGVKEIQRPFEAAANVTGTDSHGVYLATV
jgi:hypothetical protein